MQNKTGDHNLSSYEIKIKLHQCNSLYIKYFWHKTFNTIVFSGRHAAEYIELVLNGPVHRILTKHC